MAPYIMGIRDSTAIFHVHLAKKSILQAFYIIALLLGQNGRLLIINTNPEFFHFSRNITLLTLQNPGHSTFCKKYAPLHTSNISYCCFKWIGGTLTNWKQISKSVLTFARFSERCEKFLIKNNIEFPRYKKIKTCFQGLLQKSSDSTVLAFSEAPDLIFVFNPNENRNMILEAEKLHIPVIAFVESNTNLQGITYPIPLNNYSLAYIYYCLKKIITLSKKVH